MKIERMIYRLGTFCILLIHPFFMQAQESDSIREKELEEVVVKRFRNVSTVKATTPVQSMTKEEMEARGYTGLADAVRRFAGVAVKDYGGIGGLKTVSVRGLGTQHTAVSYDGIVINNTQAGQIDIGQFSLDNIGMLSLMVGQDDDIFQPAKMMASAGVLSMQTAIPDLDSEKNYNIQARLKGGSFGFMNPSFRYYQKITGSSSVWIDGNYLRADGTYPFTLRNGSLVTKEKRYNSDIESYFSELNFRYQPDEHTTLNLKGYYFDSERGLPGSIILYQTGNKERLWDKNFFAQGQFKKHFSPLLALKTQMKYTYLWSKYRDESSIYENGMQTDKHKQQEYYLSSVLLYEPMVGFSASFAGDYIFNTLTSEIPGAIDPKRNTVLGALSLKYQKDYFTIIGNLTGTYITEESDKGEVAPDRHRFSPSLSLNIRPLKKHNLNIRFLYKNTYRTPTFNDLYYLRVGNRKLKPEIADEYNVGITWAGQLFRFTDYCKVTVDGYRNRVKDKIVALPTTYIWSMMNKDKVRITGLDATIAVEIPVNKHIVMNVTGSYAYQKAIDVTDSDSKAYKHLLPYSPKNSGNGAIGVQMPWINFSYTFIAVGERYILPQNTQDNLVDGYVEHTISLNREFEFASCKLRLQGEVINLADEQYDVIKYYPMPGRSFRGTLSIEF